MCSCGKTTQIPQFILERHISSDKGLGASCPRVLCCQPRRLAAVGVATRVAAERGCKIGEVCNSLYFALCDIY